MKIALLVLGAIAIAFLGINFLKGKNIFLPQQNYYAVYPRVDGLTATNPITINGLKVGQVARIGFLPGSNDKLLVSLRITNPDVKLTKNSTAKIISADILGSKGVELLVKPGARAVPGDTLNAEIQEGIMDVVGEQLAPLQAKAENLIVSVDSVLIVLRSVLNESSLDQLGQSFYGIRGTFESLLNSAKNVEELLESEKGNISRAVGNLATTTDVLQKNAEGLDVALQNIEKITTDVAEADLKTTLLSAQKAVAGLDEVLEGINNGKGSLGLLTQTDSLHNRAVAAITDLEYLLEDLRQNPSRYVSFSLIGKKQKGVSLTKPEEKKLMEMLKDE